MNGLTVRPGSSDPFYIVSYYLKWVTTSWTHSMTYTVLQIMFNLLKFEAKKYCAHFKLISTNLNMILSEKKCWHLKIICFFISDVSHKHFFILFVQDSYSFSVESISAYQRSLAHFYTASHYIQMDRTLWTESTAINYYWETNLQYT